MRSLKASRTLIISSHVPYRIWHLKVEVAEICDGPACPCYACDTGPEPRGSDQTPISGDDEETAQCRQLLCDRLLPPCLQWRARFYGAGQIGAAKSGVSGHCLIRFFTHESAERCPLPARAGASGHGLSRWKAGGGNEALSCPRGGETLTYSEERGISFADVQAASGCNDDALASYDKGTGDTARLRRCAQQPTR